MKNIIFVCMLLISITSYAGTGAVSITNNTSCDYIVTMFGHSATMIGGTPGCTDLISVTFTVPATTTYSWADPYDFEGGYLGGSLGGVGFTTYPGGYSSVCGSSCYGVLWPWSGYYPSDWMWTYATVDHAWYSCSCGPAGSIGQISCAGAMTIYGPISCTTGTSATWVYSASAPFDVTITIN
jgi:hypothetical protein